MLVLVNGNKFKIDRQQHNTTSNFVSANSLIAKFIRYDASSIASLCVNASDEIWYISKVFWFYLKHKKKAFFANKFFNLFFKWHVDECI